jgi:RsiW-degrading membrane proteinase PrsW (M82 family)
MVLMRPRALRWLLAGVGLAALAAALAIDLDALAAERILPADLADLRGPLRVVAWGSLALTLALTAVVARPALPSPGPVAAEIVIEPETFSTAQKRVALTLGAVAAGAGVVALLALLSEGLAGFLFWPMLTSLIVAFALGGTVVSVQARQSLRGVPSRRLRLPAPWTLVLTFALVLASGEVLRRGASAEVTDVVFVPWLLLGAALPPLAAVSMAAIEVRVPPSARRMGVAAVAGGTLSVIAALIFNGLLPAVAALLVAPVADMLRAVIALIDEGRFSDLLRSPGALFVLTTLAVVAPVVEEAVKPLGVIILGRRIQHARDALLLGLACGAGFGIIENVMYEGAFFANWAGVTAVRAVGGALHPVGAGLVSLGWFGVFRHRPEAWRQLGRYYVIAAGLHALWNGASGIFMLLESANARVLGPVDLTGMIIDAGLLFVLLAEGIGTFWIVRHVSRRLGAEAAEPVPAPAPARVLATWAIACIAVLLPVAIAAATSILQYLGTARLR